MNSLSAAGGVALAAMAVVAGSIARDRVDLGGKTLTEAPLANLVASRDNTSVPEGDYFYEIANLLKREYVEPIKDEGKLAIGAVRGMVGSLGDPQSLFMDKDEFASYMRRRQGEYEGVGVELDLVLPPSATPKQTQAVMSDSSEAAAPSDGANAIPRIPKVTVTAVVPGGPADRAGVKPGDTVAYVDDHWVWDTDLIVRFRKAQRDWQAKKLDVATLNALRKEVRAKTDRDLMPLKARQRIMLGKKGAVKVVWTRNGIQRTTTLERSISHMPEFAQKGSEIRLALTPGAAQRLKAAIAGRKAVTLDLTDNVLGDFAEMQRVLAAVAPSGSYGAFINHRGSKPIPFTVTQGNPNPPKLTLKVDTSTRGAAAILADALTSTGRATLSGVLPSNPRQVNDTIELPDGSGYTLVTRIYQPARRVKA